MELSSGWPRKLLTLANIARRQTYFLSALFCTSMIGACLLDAVSVGCGSNFVDCCCFTISRWELAARKMPYEGMNGVQVSVAVLTRGLRPTIPSDCPADLADLMKVCVKLTGWYSIVFHC